MTFGLNNFCHSGVGVNAVGPMIPNDVFHNAVGVRNVVHNAVGLNAIV